MNPRPLSGSAFADFESLPPQFSRQLSRLITERDEEAIVETLRTMMLTASLNVRVPREGGRGNSYAAVPDWRARGWAAVRLAEIKFGRPRQQVDLNVTAALHAPLSRDEAARELMQDWPDIKRIGDDYVEHLKRALPAPTEDVRIKEGCAELVDVDLDLPASDAAGESTAEDQQSPASS